MQSKIIKLLIVFLICGGCSTIATLESRSYRHDPYTEMTNECKIYDYYGVSQQPVYSGSRYDLSWIVYPWRCYGEKCWGVIMYPVFLPYYLIDLPFSLFADTIGLPYTYNLQYNECPNVNWAELSKKRSILEARIRLYYTDYSNPLHIWMLSSTALKGTKSKDEFIKYLEINKYVIEYQNGDIRPQRIVINKNKATVIMEEAKHFNYSLFPWHDYWVYENDNWYIDKTDRKTDEKITLF